MKTIGLIGGLSWESTATYYRLINQTVNERLGGLHSASCLLYSFDFAEIEALQHRGNWDAATQKMIGAAQSLEKAGAEVLLICSNTMHKMADEVQHHAQVPLLHIADATAQRICHQGLIRVGLLGTRFTMEQEFYQGRLTATYGLEVLVPDEAERTLVHDVIYQELCLGILNPASKERYCQVIEALIAQGAEGIILGCTEIMLLVQQADSPVPVFDTTAIHAIAAVDYALRQSPPQ